MLGVGVIERKSQMWGLDDKVSILEIRYESVPPLPLKGYYEISTFQKFS